MANEEPKIMTKPLPDILDELETWHNENRALINEARDLIARLKDALDAVTEATSVAKQAAAEAREAGVKAAEEAEKAAYEAREAGLKAADQVAKDLSEDIKRVGQIATDARATANLVGIALMTFADGMRVTVENLVGTLKTKFEFKK